MVIGNPGLLPGLAEFFRADRTGMPLQGAQTLLQTVLFGGVCPFQKLGDGFPDLLPLQVLFQLPFRFLALLPLLLTPVRR